MLKKKVKKESSSLFSIVVVTLLVAIFLLLLLDVVTRFRATTDIDGSGPIKKVQDGEVVDLMTVLFDGNEGSLAESPQTPDRRITRFQYQIDAAKATQ